MRFPKIVLGLLSVGVSLASFGAEPLCPVPAGIQKLGTSRDGLRISYRAVRGWASEDGALTEKGCAVCNPETGTWLPDASQCAEMRCEQLPVHCSPLMRYMTWEGPSLEGEGFYCERPAESGQLSFTTCCRGGAWVDLAPGPNTRSCSF